MRRRTMEDLIFMMSLFGKVFLVLLDLLKNLGSNLGRIVENMGSRFCCGSDFVLMVKGIANGKAEGKNDNEPEHCNLPFKGHSLLNARPEAPIVEAPKQIAQPFETSSLIFAATICGEISTIQK